MDVRFADNDLKSLEKEPRPKTKLDRSVVRAFKKVMRFIRDAKDERDLYNGGQQFEKLKGKRSHQRSMRLNDQFRLIIEIERADPKNVVVVISIEDYHK